MAELEQRTQQKELDKKEKARLQDEADRAQAQKNAANQGQTKGFLDNIKTFKVE